MDLAAEERAYRGLPPSLLRKRMVHQHFLDIKEQIRSMVSSCWLSVNRHSNEERLPDEKKLLSAVDQKLFFLSNRLIKYFSQLSKEYADNTLEFQKNSFLTLLTSEKEGQLINFSRDINIDDENKSLSKVFELLGLERKQYEKKLNTHLDKFASSMKSYNKKKAEGNQSLNSIEFAAMYNAWKAHSLVQHYETLQQKEVKIFELRNKFIQIVNELFASRKVLTISETNELVFSTKSGRKIEIEDLSSGEKQLLIIVGEALLQLQSTVVYIADEPELSLHVSWQEQLTNAITRLNPNAQILFATHSPDIVSTHSDKIINMESVLR
jgi:predicted ATPase